MTEIMLIKRSDLSVRIVDSEAVIVDKNSGDVHQLNPTASYIWDCFDGHTAIAEVCKQVSNDFNIDLSRAKEDVRQVVNDLKALELLVEYKG